MCPTIMCSGPNCTSQAAGAASSDANDAGMGLNSVWLEVFMAATDTGGETHDGGQSSDSYPGSETDSWVAEVDLFLAAGESYRLENVSAVKFFFPGT